MKKYIILNIVDKNYPYKANSGNMKFTWAFEYIKIYDSYEKAKSDCRMNTSSRRTLVIRDYNIYLRKAKLEQINNSNDTILL